MSNNGGYSSEYGPYDSFSFNRITLYGDSTPKLAPVDAEPVYVPPVYVAPVVMVPAMDPVIATQVSRLYDTVLNREADAGGLAYWSQVIQDKQMTLEQVAKQFLGSAEFQSQHPGLDNTGLITVLFNNALNRDPGENGLNDFNKFLSSGTITEAQLITGISESPEHLSIIQQRPAADAIDRLFDTTFNRGASESDINYWSDHTNNIHELADILVTSAEFQLQGTLNDADFVQLLYNNALNRTGSAGEVDAWVNALHAGSSRADVVIGFSESAEHIALTSGQSGAAFDQGIIA